jgi:hypothetical protein
VNYLLTGQGKCQFKGNAVPCNILRVRAQNDGELAFSFLLEFGEQLAERRPGQEFTPYPHFRPHGRFRDRIKRNCQFFVSHQDDLFMPRSLLRPLSGRAAYHHEGHPCSFLSRAFCPINSLRSTSGMPMQSSCAAKQPRCSPVDDNRKLRQMWKRHIPHRGGPGGRHIVQSGDTIWHQSQAEAATSASTHRIGTAGFRYRTANWQE